MPEFCLDEADALIQLCSAQVMRMSVRSRHMHDIDHDQLYAVAESQAGYFTAGQAITAGMDRSTLSHHARPGGRYQRVGRGLYRLRHYPSSAHEHVVSAWLALRVAGAVVSHDSALELYDLADVIPDVVHLSVPRSQRGQRPRAGVRLHTLVRPLAPDETRPVAGVVATSPERTLIDCAAGGTAPEQVELAIRQALARTLTTPRRLTQAVAPGPKTLRDLVARALGGARPETYRRNPARKHPL
jgi:predicted transcriptional regulator of viral defense system